ncbi:hypothetical protein A464_plas0121 (plasmid) [Salmonella bongori N268-08]|uniref:Uncharacterized protein n=1 Tax=Salmonella bongori N268-08 TaxID=1197719 RepID=S5NH25_SALBN|nr:hypothetical protein A464_plas0121 [Salmonella bongori N268-08]
MYQKMPVTVFRVGRRDIEEIKKFNTLTSEALISVIFFA